MSNASHPPFEPAVMGNQIAIRRTARGTRCQHGSARSSRHGRSPRGSVADPDLTPPPAGGGVNMPIVEARAIIGVIAEVVVTVVVIAREVTVREEASAKAAVSIVVAAKAVVSIVVAAKVVVSIAVAAKAGAMRFGPTEAAQMRTSEPSHGAAAGMFATKSATHVATAESATHVAASESAAPSMTATAASESSASSMTATAASESSASSMTATAALESSASSMTAAASSSSMTTTTTTTTTATDRPGGQGVRPHCCAERDGDEEDHDLAGDRLLLDAAR
jgi:hypothetical protein